MDRQARRRPPVQSLEKLGHLGTDQLEFVRKDVAGLSADTPIVVFSHIPLFAMYPAWGWGTDDAVQALSHLRRFSSVTCLNGHVHQLFTKTEGNVTFHSATTTAYPLPHMGLYLHGYRVIPVVGPSFLWLASASFAVALLLLFGDPIILRLVAAGLAAGALGGFVLSRTAGVAGFVERGWQPAPQALISVIVEAAALMTLAVPIIARLRRRGGLITERTRESQS